MRIARTERPEIHGDAADAGSAETTFRFEDAAADEPAQVPGFAASAALAAVAGAMLARRSSR